MIWQVKIGDLLILPEDPYKYKITDIQKEWTILENILTHEYSEIMTQSLKERATIIRRQD